MRKPIAGLKSFVIMIAAVASLLALVATASAVSGDRNNDGIPDRWAKKHGLSASKNQANRDQDRDHVRNLCEYETGMDPLDRNSDGDRRADGREDSDHDGMVNWVESEIETVCDDDDSDDDGTEDGDEVSGYVHSFDGDVLKLRMVDGTILSEPLAEYAYVNCEHDEYVKPADGKPTDDSTDSEDVKSSQNSGDSQPDASDCGSAALVPGAVVKAFYVEEGMFVKVKLLR